MAHPPPPLAAALAAKGSALHHVEAPVAPAPQGGSGGQPHGPPPPSHEAHVVGGAAPSISAADITNRAAGLHHVEKPHPAGAAEHPIPQLAAPATTTSRASGDGSHPPPSRPPPNHPPPPTPAKHATHPPAAEAEHTEHAAAAPAAHRPLPSPVAHPAPASHPTAGDHPAVPPPRPTVPHPPAPGDSGASHPPPSRPPPPAPASHASAGDSHPPPPPVPPHTDVDASATPAAPSAPPPVPAHTEVAASGAGAHGPPPPVPPHTAADAQMLSAAGAAEPAKPANVPIMAVHAPPHTVDFNTVGSIDGLPKPKFSAYIEGGFGLFLNGVKEELIATTTPQVWEVHRLPDLTVWLFLPETQRFITAEKFLGIAGDVTVRCVTPKDFEQWSLVYIGSNAFGLKSKHGYFLSFDKDSGHVRARQDSVGADDKRSSLFHFRAVDPNAVPAPLTLSQQKNAGLLGRLFGAKEEPHADVQISAPTNYRQTAHVGFDAKTGLDISQLPPEYKKLFQAAGIRKSELKNPETAAAVLDAVMAPPPPPPPPPSGAAHPPAVPATPGAPPPPAPPAHTPPAAPKGPSLLEQLQARSSTLNKVELPDIKDKNAAELAPMQNALAAVIAARRKAMTGGEEDSGSSATDNDWNE